MPELTEHERPETVPPQALLLSLLSLWVPVASTSLFPEWTRADVGVVVWILALIPPFLLSYYRGWMGASVALAGGMAAFAVAQILVTAGGASMPPTDLVLGVTLVLIFVSLGSGALSSVFRQSLGAAEQMALTDPGTGLPNRRHGMIHLQRAFAAADRGAAVSVVMFDLDKFKRINDRYGHHTGDEVLRVFADVLRDNTRAMHLSSRFGGEEFMTVLDETTPEQATRMAEKVLEQLRSREFPWGHVTVSAGISTYEAGMASPDVLVAAADQALYRAKARGGNQVVVLARQGTDEEAVLPAVGRRSDRQGNGELVLVVDDDPAVLRTLSRALLRRRYQPIEASDPLRALQIVRGLDDPLDLIITDVVMPEMSGFRLVEMLLEIQPDLRALYISGYSSDEVRWSGVPGRVKSFLPKPIALDTLTGAVSAILDADAPRSPDAATPAAPEVDPHVAGTQAPSVDDLSDRLEASSARLDEVYSELLVRLSRAAEYRDDVTGQHAERVARLAGLLATEIGLEDAEAGRIEQAALLHDVGKIAIPDSVLRKPDALTPTERSIMEQHTLAGADLLAGSRNPLLREAERIARSHHERWDGSGYPDGLAGDDIPVSARITAVADALDSLTEVRPYRPPVSPEEALRKITEDRGSHFDPTVVDALIQLAQDGRLAEVMAAGRAGRAGRWKGALPEKAVAAS